MSNNYKLSTIIESIFLVVFVLFLRFASGMLSWLEIVFCFALAGLCAGGVFINNKILVVAGAGILGLLYGIYFIRFLINIRYFFEYGEYVVYYLLTLLLYISMLAIAASIILEFLGIMPDLANMIIKFGPIVITVLVVIMCIYGIIINGTNFSYLMNLIYILQASIVSFAHRYFSE